MKFPEISKSKAGQRHRLSKRATPPRNNTNERNGPRPGSTRQRAVDDDDDDAMTHPFADYNKYQAQGVLVGNWVEEHALKTSTGTHRYEVSERARPGPDESPSPVSHPLLREEFFGTDREAFPLPSHFRRHGSKPSRRACTPSTSRPRACPPLAGSLSTATIW